MRMKPHIDAVNVNVCLQLGKTRPDSLSTNAERQTAHSNAFWAVAAENVKIGRDLMTEGLRPPLVVTTAVEEGFAKNVSAAAVRLKRLERRRYQRE